MANKMYSQVETITPKRATEALETMRANRPPSMKKVAIYRKHVLDGTFMLTHQGIAFDVNGCLIDGQHRLLAIIEANKPVQMYVTYNADPASFDRLDIGKLRDDVDLFALSGEVFDFTANKNVITLIRNIAEPGGANSNIEDLSRRNSLTLKTARAYEQEIIKYGRRFITAGRTRLSGVHSAAVGAAICRAAKYLDPSDIARAIDLLVLGYSDGYESRDKTILSVRNKLLAGDIPGSGSQVGRARYNLVTSALKLFAQGSIRKVIPVEKADIFPLVTLS